MDRVRTHPLLRVLVLASIGPALGACAVAAAYKIGGVGWLLYVVFVVAWLVLSYRLLRRPARPHWKACVGAVGSVVWTWIALWLVLIFAVAAGPD